MMKPKKTSAGERTNVKRTKKKSAYSRMMMEVEQEGKRELNSISDVDALNLTRKIVKFAYKHGYVIHPCRDIEDLVRHSKLVILYGNRCPCAKSRKGCPCEEVHDDIRHRGVCTCHVLCSKKYVKNISQPRR